MTRPAPSAYLLCATPRSGSTLLCDLLTATGVAGCPASYLRSEDIGYWAGVWGLTGPTDATDAAFNRAYLHAMTRAGTADTGIFGLRLMWGSVAEALARSDSALGWHADLPTRCRQMFGLTRFVHLSRQDKLAQAVSLVRARQTGLWHLAADGSERERTGAAQAPVFDADAITRTRDALADDDAAWGAFFDRHGIQPVQLTYEGLAANPHRVLADLLTALGQDPQAADNAAVQTSRLSDATSLDWTNRLRLGRE